MTIPSAFLGLSDALERERAASTFDQNVVVTAGAGTGKTSLLVDRLVHLLMRDPKLNITEIVALTFTNKAANEMKLRLRERLESYLAVALDRHPSDLKEERLQREVRSLMERYHLAKSQLDTRAREALRNVERSEIGTIHSFAATLLRLYPMEAGIDPQFREDEGVFFERAFHERWRVWLDEELSIQGIRKEDWKRVLREVSLEDIKELAFSVCSEAVDLDQLAELTREKRIPGPILSWLENLKETATALSDQHPEERVNERLLRASLAMIERFLEAGQVSEGKLDGEKSFLVSGRGINRNTRGWEEEEAGQAQQLVRVARGLCQVDGSLTSLLCDLLIPFAQSFRKAFTQAGLISFDGLLVQARNLVRDQPAVREELKRQFKAILIDEFQDTDPIQYEILIYLAEEIGHHARDWREVRLTPGKIFVVGDPKQSIYAFRRADIEAYLEVIEKIIKAQSGVECQLATNFRSHAGILDVVNGVFAEIIQPREGLQPSYGAIHPPPPASAEQAALPRPLPFRKAAIRRVEAVEEKVNADLGRRLEAENLARWLEEEVLGKAEVLDRERKPILVQPKDVAILLRKLTDAHEYIEPLRRRGIRYVVEGERHFYAVQEIIDAVNLLRAVENPYDRLALVGILRSPLGGLKDSEIYELHREKLLDYRAVTRLRNEKKFSSLQELYEILHRLHRESRKLPVGEAVSRIFDSLPIRLLAASSFHGEQAVANLEKLRQQAELLGRDGLCTLKEAIALLERRVLDVEEEGESALAEESLDAVRILSIHKAKGLEFPVVILAGCHMIPDPRRGKPAEVLYDWSHNLAGLRVGQYSSLAGLYIAEKARIREEEEQKRVLYVAMTRAREQLTLSWAPAGKYPSGSFVSMLEGALKTNLASAEPGLIPAGRGVIELQVVREMLAPPGRLRPKPKDERSRMDWKAYARLWEQRTLEYETILRTPLFLSPSLLKQREKELTDGHGEGTRPRRKHPVSSSDALLTGELAHRFLQEWDFREDPKNFREKLTPFLEKRLAPGSSADRRRIQEELETIFELFFSSESYEEISSSLILGREVPFLIPWDGNIMEGVIDLLYEKEGRLYLADYKTDRVGRSEIPEAVDGYRHQIQIYSEAVRRSLRREVAGFKLVFLRLGEAVEALNK